MVEEREQERCGEDDVRRGGGAGDCCGGEGLVERVVGRGGRGDGAEGAVRVAGGGEEGH